MVFRTTATTLPLPQQQQQQQCYQSQQSHFHANVTALRSLQHRMQVRAEAAQVLHSGLSLISRSSAGPPASSTQYCDCQCGPARSATSPSSPSKPIATQKTSESSDAPLSLWSPQMHAAVLRVADLGEVDITAGAYRTALGMARRTATAQLPEMSHLGSVVGDGESVPTAGRSPGGGCRMCTRRCCCCLNVPSASRGEQRCRNHRRHRSSHGKRHGSSSGRGRCDRSAGPCPPSPSPPKSPAATTTQLPSAISLLGTASSASPVLSPFRDQEVLERIMAKYRTPPTPPAEPTKQQPLHIVLHCGCEKTGAAPGVIALSETPASAPPPAATVPPPPPPSVSVPRPPPAAAVPPPPPPSVSVPPPLSTAGAPSGPKSSTAPTYSAIDKERQVLLEKADKYVWQLEQEVQHRALHYNVVLQQLAEEEARSAALRHDRDALLALNGGLQASLDYTRGSGNSRSRHRRGHSTSSSSTPSCEATAASLPQGASESNAEELPPPPQQHVKRRLPPAVESVYVSLQPAVGVAAAAAPSAAPSPPATSVAAPTEATVTEGGSSATQEVLRHVLLEREAALQSPPQPRTATAMGMANNMPHHGYSDELRRYVDRLYQEAEAGAAHIRQASLPTATPTRAAAAAPSLGPSLQLAAYQLQQRQRQSALEQLRAEVAVEGERMKAETQRWRAYLQQQQQQL